MIERWGMPLLVVGVLLAAGIWVALLPVEADHHDCGASSIAIVTGADVPPELSEDCHAQARTHVAVAAVPTGAALVGVALTVAIVRRVRPTT